MSGKPRNRSITLATAHGKIPKSEADYINYSRVKRCDDCVMFRPPGECTTVAGDISPSGHCRFWERKSRLPVGD